MTSLLCISSILGIIFGYTCPTFFFTDNMSEKEFKNNMINYLFVEAIISTSLCIPVIIFIKSKPEKAPSNSQLNYDSPPLKECLNMMIKNKSLLKFLFSFTGILSYFNVYGTITNGYFSQYGLKDDETSYISGFSNAMAIISSIVTSIILDKYKIYKKAFIILIVFAILSHLSMTIFLETQIENKFYFVLFLCSLICSSILPIYTVGMDFVCELTYPVGESISGGFIMSFNQIFGVIGVKSI